MGKILEKGTKVKMIESVGVALASMITNNFEVGSVGEIIKKHHDSEETSAWYEVQFENGTEIIPEVWFTVVEEPKEECDCNECEKCCDDIELPENDGVELKIKYNGDDLEVVGDDGINLKELSEKEVFILYNTVDTLYRLLGVDLDD